MALEDAIEQYRRQQIAERGGVDPHAWPAIEDASGWAENPPELPKLLVHGLYHSGSVVVIGGASKSHKSWTMIDLAMCLACGIPFMGFETSQSRVLYLNFEIDTPFFQNRVIGQQGHREIMIPEGMFRVANLAGKACSYVHVMSKLREMVKPGDVDVIFLDPIYMILGNLKESDPGDMTIFFNAIKALAVDLGVAVIVATHFTKGAQGMKNHNDRISGSGVFSRAPDVILTITELQGEDEYVLSGSFRNLKPMPPVGIRWQFPFFSRDDSIDVTTVKVPGGGAKATEEAKPGRPKADCESKILDLLADSSKDIDALIDALDVSRSTLYRALRALERSGKVLQQAGTGRWSRVFAKGEI